MNIFCLGIPATMLLAGLVAFPPWLFRGILWINLIPLSALCAGALFVWWQRVRPMVPDA